MKFRTAMLISIGMIFLLNGCAPSQQEIQLQKQKELKKKLKLRREREKQAKIKAERYEQAKFYLTQPVDNQSIFDDFSKYINKVNYTKDQFETTKEFHARQNKIKDKLLNKKFIFDIKNYQHISTRSGDRTNYYPKAVYNADTKKIYTSLAMKMHDYRKDAPKSLIVDYRQNSILLRGEKDLLMEVFSIQTKLPHPDSQVTKGLNVFTLYPLNGEFTKNQAKEIINNIDIKLVTHFDFDNLQFLQKNSNNNDDIGIQRRMRNAYNRGRMMNGAAPITIPIVFRYTYKMSTDMIIISNKKTNDIYRIIY